MQRSQLLSNILMLSITAFVTIGTLYISVQAASQQEADLDAPAVTTPSSVVNEIAAETTPQERPAELDQRLIRADRSHDVFLDATGSFSGHLIPANESFGTTAGQFTVGIVQNGAIARQMLTDEEGQFSFSELDTGVGGLFAFNETTFLLFGIRFIAEDDRNIANNVQEFDVISATVVASDANIASQILAPDLSGNNLRFTGPSNAGDETFPFGAGIPATSLINHHVQLLPDGSLHGTANCIDPRTGRLREIQDVIVYFVRDNQLIARTRVEPSGEFAVSGLSAGTYSVIATGTDGAFAIAVEIIGRSEEEIAAVGTLPKYEPTALASTLEFASALVPSTDLIALYESGLMQDLWQISDVPFPCGDIPCQGPCCGVPGGSAFSGGGGLGGGGLGGGAGGAAGGGGGALGLLLGGAIGGGVGYLLGGDGNGGGGGITPASPSQ